jgi:putative transposase
MSNHIHLLLTEPDGNKLATAIQVLKQRFSRTRTDEFVWEPRYHDFNVFTETKRIEKLRYMHRNPVKAGLVERPEGWPWSSFNSYATNQPQPVQISR